jgi:hypothetical protein
MPPRPNPRNRSAQRRQHHPWQRCLRQQYPVTFVSRLGQRCFRAGVAVFLDPRQQIGGQLVAQSASARPPGRQANDKPAPSAVLRPRAERLARRSMPAASVSTICARSQPPRAPPGAPSRRTRGPPHRPRTEARGRLANEVLDFALHDGGGLRDRGASSRTPAGTSRRSPRDACARRKRSARSTGPAAPPTASAGGTHGRDRHHEIPSISSPRATSMRASRPAVTRLPPAPASP